MKTKLIVRPRAKGSVGRKQRVTESCRGNVWLVSSDSIRLNGTVDFGSFVVGSLSKVLPFWGTSAFMFSAVFSGLS